jgi:diaminohydroxyphosphoribosylaminopyrimidine deaminase / 5-amino-6-(5-phosphoribosylamino)uracil reductase
MGAFSAADLRFMRRALELASLARPSPNPRVGAVVVRDGEIVGEGYHERPGLPHAEVIALRAAGGRAPGATIYITLEPCCHAGRTGPCTEAVLEAGIGRVVVGMIDPDANVRGRGVALLEARGIEVSVGALEGECQRMLEGYVVHRSEGRPLVRLKAAVSLDGAIAARDGESKWISGGESRRRAHALRAESDVVVVGAGTVLSDDPLLTVRDAPGATPLRLVVDSKLRTPVASRLVSSATPSLPVLLAHTDAGRERAAAFENRAGLETLACRADAEDRVDLKDLVARLAARGVLSILVEGGAKVLSAFARQGLADRFSLFVAPKLIGSARSWIALPENTGLAYAISLRFDDAVRLGDDFLLEGAFVRETARPA